MDEAEPEPEIPEEANAPEVDLTVVLREGWGALPAKGEMRPLTHPVKNVAMAYNTEVKPCFNKDECKERMRELQLLHMEKGLPDLHYNFLVGTDGNVYEGRGWDFQPEDFNEKPELDETSICIGVIGDGAEPDDSKPLEFITAVYFANWAVEQGYVEEEYTVCEDTQKLFS